MGNLNCLGSDFDASSMPERSFTPVPVGDYVAFISSSEMMPTKAGGECLKLTYTIAEGEHQGRLIFDRLNLVNANPKAVEIAKRGLAEILRAVGLTIAEDSSELHDKPLIIKVGIEPGNDQYPNPSNKITKVSAIGGTKSTPPAPAKTAAAATPTIAVNGAAKKPMPWAKK